MPDDESILKYRRCRRFSPAYASWTGQIPCSHRGQSVYNQRISFKRDAALWVGVSLVGQPAISGWLHLSAASLAIAASTYGAIPARATFVQAPTFDQIVDLYSFDRKLRIVFLDALDRIEVGLKSTG
jgi:hypothetical protein